MAVATRRPLTSDGYNQTPDGRSIPKWAELAPERRPDTEWSNPLLETERLTDSANAELIAHLFGHTLKFDHRRGRWLVWNSHLWVPDCNGQVHRLAKQAARERYDNAVRIEDTNARVKVARFAIQSESRMRLDAALSLARHEPPIADDGTSWDTDPWLLGTPNAVVDLTTGESRYGKPQDRITMCTGTEFDAEAECPRWLQFLDEVFGDTDLIDWLQRALGYSLTGDTSEQCVFLGYGVGANGKGVFSNTLHYVLDDYAFSSPFATFELYQRAGIPNDLAALENKRFVSASETNDGTRLNEGRIKALSGCDPITARYLHQEYFTFWPHLKLWLFVNHKPKVVDDSFGFWRRVRLIPFTKQFAGGNEDKNLSATLRAEAPGILVWLVRGCLEWQRRGLEPIPACVRAATEEYKQESDPLAEFIAARCVEHENATVKAADLYGEYKTWADEQGMGPREMLTSTAFGRRIAQHHLKTRGSSGNVYHGIGLAVYGSMYGSEREITESTISPIDTLPSRGNIENPTQPYIHEGKHYTLPGSPKPGGRCACVNDRRLMCSQHDWTPARCEFVPCVCEHARRSKREQR